MSALSKNAVVLILTGLSLTGTSASAAEVLEEITIIGMREDRSSKGATGLDLTQFETPQSVSLLDGQLLRSFNLDDINSALELVTGVNVEEAETDRTYYNARGFDITSMHVDGVGIPFDGLVHGSIDTALYEKVEIVRGANGLITGIGNPSGTINYVRKRPLNDLMVSGEFTYGSWDRKRAVVDVSSPLTDSGRWAARGVVAVEDKESWLNLYQHQRASLYGIVDGQLTDDITLALGFTRQDSRSDGVLWGALPFVYSDGTQAEYDVSTTTSMNWTYWESKTDTSFIEMGVNLPHGWRWLSTVTHTSYEEPSELFYVYLNPGLDPETGLGVQGWPGKFLGESKSLQWDNNVSGDFELGAQTHQVTVGLSLADQERLYWDTEATTGFQPMPAFPGWQGDEVARPVWGATTLERDSDIQLNRLYGAARLSLADPLKLIVGFNVVDYKSRGVSWDVSTDTDNTEVSPYLGLTWSIVPGLNAYASFSDIYQPQYEQDDDQQPLGPALGKSYEAGLKKQWFDGALLASLAVFQVEQENLAEFERYSDCDDIPDDDTTDDFDCSEYRAVTVESEGAELEIYGFITDSLLIQTGYTKLKLEDPNGEESRTFIPRESFKLITRWSPNAINGLELGLSARWQSKIHNSGITQEAYAVAGGFASYEFNDALSLTLNAENVTDEKYLSSLQWEQAFYGAPRHYSASLRWNL